MADSTTAKKRKKAEPQDVFDGPGGIDNGDSKGKKKKKGQKKGKGRRLIIILVLILLLAAFAVAVFHFNLFGFRTTFFGFLHNLDPEFQSIEVRTSELDKRESDLERLQTSLDSQQEKLAELQRQLDEKEDELEVRETSRTPVYRPPVNEDDVTYMTNIGKIYAGMDPANAADVMVRLYSIEDMAAIIYYMSQSSASSVLEAMDPDIAAQITDRLLNE